MAIGPCTAVQNIDLCCYVYLGEVLGPKPITPHSMAEEKWFYLIKRTQTQATNNGENKVKKTKCGHKGEDKVANQTHKKRNNSKHFGAD